MDKREMRRKLQMALIRELFQNQTNQFGETRQEIVLSKMDIYNPSEATKRRFSNLVTDMMLNLQAKEK
jgi:FKBP-type peptidyl-prolyl cis-trans isomerase (trigger factor)